MRKLYSLFIAHFVSPYFETFQRVGAKRTANGDIGGVAATGYQHTADARYIIAGVEGIPTAVKVSFEPTGEIHSTVGRRHADIAQVTCAIACRNVHAATECDRKVRVITTNTGFLLESLPRSFSAACVFIAK